MEIISETTQTASRNLKHKCSECMQPITKGQLYRRLVQKWDGEIQSDNSHESCTVFAHKIHDVPRGQYSPLEHSDYADCGGRKWLWDAMWDCWETKWEIIKLSRPYPEVRRRLLTLMWNSRQRGKPS